MIRNLPPFRADHVGSLLRPAVLKEARAKRENRTVESVVLENRSRDYRRRHRTRQRGSAREFSIQYPRPWTPGR